MNLANGNKALQGAMERARSLPALDPSTLEGARSCAGDEWENGDGHRNWDNYDDYEDQDH